MFYVPSTARSFREGTTIYFPLRTTWNTVFTPFPPGIKPGSSRGSRLHYHCATPAPCDGTTCYHWHIRTHPLIVDTLLSGHAGSRLRQGHICGWDSVWVAWTDCSTCQQAHSGDPRLALALISAGDGYWPSLPGEEEKIPHMYHIWFGLVCWGLTSLFNIWGHSAKVPACNSSTLSNVLPHRNAMQQKRDMAPHPVTE